jgi:hypothetical protein
MSGKIFRMSEVTNDTSIGASVKLTQDKDAALLKTTQPDAVFHSQCVYGDDDHARDRNETELTVPDVFKNPASEAALQKVGAPGAVEANAVASDTEFSPGSLPPARPLSFPGAFAMTPTGFTEEVIVHESCDFTLPDDHANPEPNASEDRMDGLAVADLVDDTPLSLPIASPKIDNAEQHSYKPFALVAAILFMASIATLVTFLVSRNSASQESRADVHASSSPSEAPSMSIDGYLLSLLSEETASAIISSPDSAQFRAFRWLLEDFDQRGEAIQPEEHIRQRFALATLYFATNGDAWLSNDNWLNHSASECVWFNQPEFAMKEMMSVMYPSYLDHFFPPDQAPPSTCNSNGVYQPASLVGPQQS